MSTSTSAIAVLRREFDSATEHASLLAKRSRTPDADTDLGSALGRVAGLARALEVLGAPPEPPKCKEPRS